MFKFTKKRLIAFISFTLTIAISAENSDSYFSENDLFLMDRGEIISDIYLKNRKSKPEDDFKIVSHPLDNNDYSDWELKASEKFFLPFVISSSNDQIDFLNILSSFSDLEGMKYYSQTSRKVIPLVEECYRVEERGYENPLKDIQYIKLPESTRSVFFQKDNRFGKLYYSSEILIDGKDFYILNTCLDSMKKFMVSVCDPQEFLTGSAFIYDSDKKGFYVYSYLCSRIKSDILLNNGLLKQESFANRLRAATVHLAGLCDYDLGDSLDASISFLSDE